MHTFQKKDKTVLTMNPFDKIGKQWMLITSGDEDKANTMTGEDVFNKNRIWLKSCNYR